MSKTAIKTTSYGIMHFTVAVAVAYAVTRSWAAAFSIGLIEPFIQTIAYAVHEKAWARIPLRRAA